MNQLTQSSIDTVRAALKGKRLEKFDASVAVIQASLAQGAWVPSGSRKANSGFYQGLCKVSAEGAWRDRAVSSLEFCLNFGQAYTGESKLLDAISRLRAMRNRKGEAVKLPADNVIVAWAQVAGEKANAVKLLDDARPLPIVTAIGLSPKVTKTLTEMNLDIDLPSIKPAKIDFDMVPGFCADTGKPLLNKDGTPKMVKRYFVSWTPGIVHGASRFSDSGGCEACGKPIPSRRFVPVEAFDKRKQRLVSFWLGCDCSRNIFGIKDLGIEKSAK